MSGYARWVHSDHLESYLAEGWEEAGPRNECFNGGFYCYVVLEDESEAAA